MRVLQQVNNRGFFTIEVMVALLVLMMLLASEGEMYFALIDHNLKGETEQRIELFTKALETHYKQRVTYEGYRNSSNLPLYYRKAILPTVVTATSLRVYSIEARKAFENAGCIVTATASYSYDMQCLDGYDNSFRFTIRNQRSVIPFSDPPTVPAFNPKLPVVFTITSAGKDRNFTTATDNVTGRWSSGDLDQKYIKETYKRIEVIADAIKTYHESRIIAETTKNTQLLPRDAVKVPWVWQLLATTPSALRLNCVIPNLSNCRPSLRCTCSNFAPSVWRTATYSSFNRSMMMRIIDNLGLPRHYIKDAFGMVMDIDLLHAGHRAANIPPVPGDNYYYNLDILNYPSMSKFGDTSYSPATVAIRPIWEYYGRQYYVAD